MIIVPVPSKKLKDAVIIQSRDANGRPIVADLSHLTLVDGYIPATLFYTPNDVNCLGYALRSVYVPAGATKVGVHAFRCCTALQNVYGLNFGQLTIIAVGAFSSCSALYFSGLSLPVVTSIGGYAFQTANTISGTVMLGSAGHAVSSIASDAFGTQSTITAITVYTVNGLASDLTGAPWGATNATINYMKA